MLCYDNSEISGVLPANNLACFLFGCLEMHLDFVSSSVLKALSAGMSWLDGSYNFEEIADV